MFAQRKKGNKMVWGFLNVALGTFFLVTYADNPQQDNALFYLTVAIIMIWVGTVNVIVNLIRKER